MHSRATSRATKTPVRRWWYRSTTIPGVRSGFSISTHGKKHTSTRLTARGVEFLIEQALSEAPQSAMIGLDRGRIRFTDLATFPKLIEPDVHRPLEQTWMDLLPIAEVMAQPGN